LQKSAIVRKAHWQIELKRDFELQEACLTMISRDFIGYEPPPFSTTVEAGRLRFFARATGQEDPVYIDQDAARAAGYSGLPVPPTFLFGVEMEAPQWFQTFEKMGVDLGRILHGEQSFEYHGDICEGDTLTFVTRVTDIYDKKDGALEFVVQMTSVTNQHGACVADLRRVIIVRN
jgi:acyl dehydratase